MSDDRQEHSELNKPPYIHRVIEQLPASLQPRARAFADNFLYTIQPATINFRPLPGEEVQLEIYMAWYRDILGTIVFNYFGWLVLFTVLAAAAIAATVVFFGLFSLTLALIPVGLFVIIGVIGMMKRFEYRQYRLLKTNARLIITIPQPNGWPLVDNIEMNAAPQIIDTNWSPNPIWRVFQFFTGARDLYLSMVGFQFAEGTARVRDALIIPDIMPDDVYELKKIVFKTK